MATKKSEKQIEWEATLEEWFAKLPPLSKNAQEAIVRITPWLALIFGILGVLGTLAGFGILTVFSPLVVLSSGLSGAAGSLISAGLGLAAAILLLLAYPGTKMRKYKGWRFIFWSEIVNIIAAVLSFSLIGVFINLIGFYLLFQIKPYYKKA